MDRDLTSVLNTLSALSGVPPAAPAASTTTTTPNSAPQTTPAPAAESTATATPVPNTATTAPASTTPGKGPDPSKITTWPPALRYITSKAQHPPFHSRLKQLISSQRAHERKWWEGREAVARRVSEREGRRGEVEGVLRAVGAPVIECKINDDDLAVYDRKIYAASVSMAEALERELAALGIPFFCLSGQPGLPEKELNELKKRMLELLMDLVDDNNEQDRNAMQR